jgi:glutamate N-acetyltransferase/amino-acid N-acetyltransferase
MTLSRLAPDHFPDMPAIAGLSLATAASGLKYTGRDDVMLMQCAEGSTLAAVFTTSDTAAAPVQWSRDRLADDTAISAILVNAGNANAFTGTAGTATVMACTTALSRHLGCAPESVMLASTGVIGEPLDATILEATFDSLVNQTTGWPAAAAAIMTTDTFAKGASANCMIGDIPVTVAGIAKGSGMIAPDMATMLGFIATDAALPVSILQHLLSAATRHSFNSITVDSDTSTNDSVFLLATAAAGNAAPQSPDDPILGDFAAALGQVMQDLAKQIVRDGEGASKLITIDVTGTADDEIAHRVAMSIANSPLVKTAIAGEDANWGRIVMAVGKSGAAIDQTQLGIDIGGVAVARNGMRVDDFDEAPVTAHMTGQHVDIAVHVGAGSGKARVWTCDLTHGYIDINADYRS